MATVKGRKSSEEGWKVGLRDSPMEEKKEEIMGDVGDEGL